MPDTLFHFSDRPDIARFDPRPAPNADYGPRGDIVWAIDADHVQNYLLPRDCPRVTFYALPSSAPEDVERLLGQTTARYVVAIEARWLPVVRSQRLYQYTLPADTFTIYDAGAGYFISREPVVPRSIAEIDDLLGALLSRDVELRVTPTLWRLRDAVVASSLQFSCIRMRNAAARDNRTSTDLAD
jgi:uncharacterized protein DUF6886